MATRIRKTFPPVQIGTVSHGTMREEDLIPCFEDFLREHGSRPPRRPKDLTWWLDGEAFADNERTAAAMEDAGYYLNEDLWARMEALAPPYTYFGASEGDGCDYGYWPMTEVAMEDIRSGELLGGEDWPENVPAGTLFLHISDHGNLELYRRIAGGKWESVWSVV